MVSSHESKKVNMKPKLELTDKERPILKHLRVAFRAVADKCDADRIARLTVLAFRLEFPNTITVNKLANAYVRSIPPLRKALAEEGGSISVSEAAKLLGISRSTVLRRYRERRLLGWRDYFGGQIQLPAWQFSGKGLLPGFDEVMAVLRRSTHLDDIAGILFFLSQYHSLDGQRPLDCLREENLEAAIRTAHSYVE
jgi:excisionase family DNA binding protein